MGSYSIETIYSGKKMQFSNVMDFDIMGSEFMIIIKFIY